MSQVKNNDLLVLYTDFLAAKHPDFKLVGRSDELNTLIRRIFLPDTNSVLLTGPSGIGRKALVRGLVKNQRADFVPNEIMVRPFYKLNVNQLFNSANPQEIEASFDKVIAQLRDVQARRGIKPVLVIEDGSNFISTVVNKGYGNIINRLINGDQVENFLDLILIADNDTKRELEKTYPTFANGFSELKLEEPPHADILQLLREHGKMHARNKTFVSDDAYSKIIELSDRYPNMFPCAQPQRALRLLDETATAYRLEMHSRPEGALEKERLLGQVKAKLNMLSQDCSVDFKESQDELETAHDTLIIELEKSYEDWAAAKKEVKELLDNMGGYDELIHTKRSDIAKLEIADNNKFAGMAKAVRDELKVKAREGGPEAKGRLESEFSVMDDQQILAFMEYDIALNRNPKIRELEKQIRDYDKGIASYAAALKAKAEALNYRVDLPVDYIEDLTGKLTKTTINPNMKQVLRNAEPVLNAKVLGQRDMVKPVADALRISAAGGQDPNAPLGVFLILGPSGVGKSLLAQVLAEEVYGSHAFLTTIAMEGFGEKHTISALLSAPPGYAGYEERGRLIAAAQDKPYSVLLLDELEKAHKDVKQALLGGLETGVITGMNGQVGDMRNMIIVAASNYGQDLFLRPDLSFAEAKKQVLERIYRDPAVFSPEFLNRTTILVANFLEPEIVCDIAMLETKKVAKRYQAKNPQFNIAMDATSAAALVADFYDKRNGARVIKNMIKTQIGNEAADRILQRPNEKIPLAGTLTAVYDPAAKAFRYSFSGNDNECRPEAAFKTAATPAMGQIAPPTSSPFVLKQA